MKYLKIFVIVYIFIFLLYIFTVILNKKKKKKIFDTNQARLVIEFNHLDVQRMDANLFAYVLSFSNSFIVAFTFTISEFFSNFILKLLVCFVTLVILILIVYKVIGLFYRKKED